jgi:hypothetical protein
MRRLLSRGNTSPCTTFGCVFLLMRTVCLSWVVPTMTRAGVRWMGCRLRRWSAPVIHEDQGRRTGCRRADSLPAPGHRWPQSPVGTTPRPRRVITDRWAPVWVQPRAGSRRRRTSCRKGSCEAGGGWDRGQADYQLLKDKFRRDRPHVFVPPGAALRAPLPSGGQCMLGGQPPTCLCITPAPNARYTHWCREWPSAC